jgi:predicted Zn-dependent peptidase
MSTIITYCDKSNMNYTDMWRPLQLFSPTFGHTRMSKITSFTCTFQLHDYVSKFYTGNNMALVGLNVDHDSLKYLAKDMGLQNNPAPATTPSQYTPG